jgi:hypothetical protein
MRCGELNSGIPIPVTLIELPEAPLIPVTLIPVTLIELSEAEFDQRHRN